MQIFSVIVSFINFIWRGVLLLWDVASAIPIATAAVIVVVAVAVVFLAVGR